MSDTGTYNADQSSTSTEDATDGTEAALESFVSRTQLPARYLVLALVLTVVWWLVLGPTALVAGIGLVVLVFGFQGFVEAVLSRRWPETEAVIVSSEVLTEPEAREYAGLDAVEGSWSTQEFSGGYVPVVRYEFTVDGRRFENAAISPFDDSLSRRKWAKTLVDKYPENGYISPRYDPDDPTRSYLRPWIRSTAGIIPVAGIVFLVAAAWIAAGMPGGAPVVAFAIGLPGIAIGLRRVVLGLRSRRWPTTTGTVTGTGVDVRSSGGDEGGGTVYVPGLQYEYTTDGISYVSTRYGMSPDSEPSFDSRKKALSWTEDNYPVDGEVTVHYDPDRPSRAVLVPGASGSIPLVLFGLGFTALGVVFLLFPGGLTL
jgi:hypothetical protein